MAIFDITDGKQILGTREIESEQELKSLQETAQAENRWWIPRTTRAVGTMLEPGGAINRCHYDGERRAGSFFKPGDDYINEAEDFASFTIDQERPEHTGKIIVCGDRRLRDLIVLLLNEENEKLQPMAEPVPDFSNKAIGQEVHKAVQNELANTATLEEKSDDHLF